MADSDFFTELEENDKRTNILSTVSSPVWSKGLTTLGNGNFNLSSIQSGSSGDYYYDVYDEDPSSDDTATVQFAVTYGHYAGSGSVSTNNGNNPSKAIYRQFRNICIKNPTSETKFKFDAFGLGNAMTDGFAADIYAITVNRARYRERLDPGNWELKLIKDGRTVTLIDDSGATKDSSIKSSQRIFNVVSGSITTGTAVVHRSAVVESGDSGKGTHGEFYPDLGIIILNPERISQATCLNIGLTRGSAGTVNDDNHFELYNAINNGNYFQARREEQIKSSHYFCRIKSGDYNWSQNPTYYSGSNAEIRNSTFIQDPKAYITTVGLYNNNNELLAVAKLSQPLLKSQDREAVIKVRLDF